MLVKTSVKTFAFVACAAALLGASPGHAQSGLRYPTAGVQSPVPVPVSEQGLQTVTAEEWFKVSDKGLQLEGAVFNRAGDLVFVEVFGGRVMSVSAEGRLRTLLEENTLGSAGLAIHRDGRIFVAGLGDFKGTPGSIYTIPAAGGAPTTVVPSSAGYLVDDLVFDRNGGYYFTDFRGTSTEPTGGVYYVAPDGKTTAILPNMAVANGVALSPDGKVLWVTEFSRGLLHRVNLENPTTVAAFGTEIVYQFTGPAPDSMRVDADGNVYVAVYGQGRVLVFNPMGIPIGQVLLPGRDEGHNLRSTSMAIKPGTNELYILTNDADGGRGSTIYRTTAFARAAPVYSHQDG